MYVNAILDRIPAQLVGRANHLAALDSTARHPNGKSVWVMIAAQIPLHHGSTAKFTGADNQRGIGHPALLLNRSGKPAMGISVRRELST